MNERNNHKDNISTSLTLIGAGLLLGIIAGIATHSTMDVYSPNSFELAIWLVPITSFFSGLPGFIYFKFIK